MEQKILTLGQFENGEKHKEGIEIDHSLPAQITTVNTLADLLLTVSWCACVYFLSLFIFIHFYMFALCTG